MTTNRILCWAIAGFLLSATAYAVESTPIGAYPREGQSIGRVRLPAPESDAERRYLGLSGTGQFALGQVRAKILVVEVFSFYCPHCQRAARTVNALFDRIEGDDKARGAIRMVGVGAGNSPYEVGLFKKTYDVRFPLFADDDLMQTTLLGARATPTFFVLQVDRNGDPKVISVSEGEFNDPGIFLTQLLKAVADAGEANP